MLAFDHLETRRMTRRWRSLGTSSPEEATAGEIAGASAVRSVLEPASMKMPATTAQAIARRSFEEVGALSQGAMAVTLLLVAPMGPYPVETGYGRAGAVSSTGFTPR